MKAAISIENLGKSYVIQHERPQRYSTLRDVLMEQVKNVGRRVLRPRRHRSTSTVTKEKFWALRDITFDVMEGERLGIIGRNGAGKSTLLKILSRITEPTTGRVKTRGRVASLLEVGTGFHPELTGRENIYLNGAILGMSKAEIRQKFDEIVAFSEVESFLDTPVKHFSSGMYVRLAFAVSAYLEPDILIIDEVLSVGDISFQEKCFGRMSEISNSGRTVLFVSHNMSAVRQFCTNALFISGGAIAASSSDIDAVIQEYLGANTSCKKSIWENSDLKYKNPYFFPKRFYIASADHQPLDMPIGADQEAYVTIEADVERFNQNLTIGYAIYTQEGQCLYWSYNTDAGDGTLTRLTPGSHNLRCRLPPRFLNEGVYQLELIGGLHFTEWLFEPRRDVPSITIEIQGRGNNSAYWINRRPTLLAPVLSWSDHNKSSMR